MKNLEAIVCDARQPKGAAGANITHFNIQYRGGVGWKIDQCCCYPFWSFLKWRKPNNTLCGYAKYYIILNCCTILFLVAPLALSVTDFTQVDSNSVCALPTCSSYLAFYSYFGFLADHSSLVLNREHKHEYCHSFWHCEWETKQNLQVLVVFG